MTRITCTVEAWKVLTEDQIAAIERLLTENTFEIVVYKGGFDLPTGYLAFERRYNDGSTIYGGIAPNGDIST